MSLSVPLTACCPLVLFQSGFASFQLWWIFFWEHLFICLCYVFDLQSLLVTDQMIYLYSCFWVLQIQFSSTLNFLKLKTKIIAQEPIMNAEGTKNKTKQMDHIVTLEASHSSFQECIQTWTLRSSIVLVRIQCFGHVCKHVKEICC